MALHHSAAKLQNQRIGVAAPPEPPKICCLLHPIWLSHAYGAIEQAGAIGPKYRDFPNTPSSDRIFGRKNFSQ
jgi:hypothetical protein